MAWRALLRRNPARSMTLVGDLDQRSGHRPVRTWAELLGRAAAEHVRTARLTINYRTPSSVMHTAVRVLRAAGGAHAAPTRSARDVPDSLVVTALDRPDRPVEVVRAERAAHPDGKLAVITAPDRVQATWQLLAEHLPGDLAAPGDDVLTSPVVVLDPVTAKGLEFDVVVLLEPAQVAAGGPGDLYVAMTRPTRRLHVLHAQPLPDGWVG